MKENTIFKAIAVLILIGILALGCVALYSGYQDLVASEDKVELVVEIDNLGEGTNQDTNSDNTCPYMSEVPAIETDEGSTIMVEVGAIDIDDDSITYDFDGVSGADIDDNKFTWETEEGDAGDYTVTVTADDGECETTMSFDITINEDTDGDDDDDEDNHAPQITAADITATEGDLISATVLVMDQDGDSVDITYSSPLDSNGQWQTGEGDAGVYTATITADDGDDTNSVTITITVLDNGVPNTNTAPEVSASDVTVTEGDLITVVPTATDADGDSITLSYTSPLDANGEWQTTTGDAGVYTATITADDGTNSTSIDITITVLEPNAVNLPDLTVSSISFNQMDQNGLVTYTTIVENIGVVDLNEQVFIEAHFVGDSFVDEYQAQGLTTLAVGSSETFTFSFDASSIMNEFNAETLSEATLDLTVTADSHQTLEESDETNNQASDSTTLYVENYVEPIEADPITDLTVSNVVFEGFTNNGGSAEYTVTLENTGTANINDPFTLRFEIIPTNGDVSQRIAIARTINSIAAGTSQEESITMVLTQQWGNEFTESYDVTTTATADCYFVIDEEDETNNVFSFVETWYSFERYEADLVVDSISISDFSMWERYIVFEINVTNTGNMDLPNATVHTDFSTNDGNFTVRDDLVMTNLTEGNTVTTYKTVDLNSLITITQYWQLFSKSYTFEVSVDPLNEINEIDTTNNINVFAGIIQNPIPVLNNQYQF